jgi:hypothetical protein
MDMTNQTQEAPAFPELEQFSAQLGSVFDIRYPEDHFPLRLREVKPLRKYSNDPAARDPFSLLFICDDSRILAQGTYNMDHAVLGTHAIFIVPVGQRDGGVEYEAVFN